MSPKDRRKGAHLVPTAVPSRPLGGSLDSSEAGLATFRTNHGHQVAGRAPIGKNVPDVSFVQMQGHTTVAAGADLQGAVKFRAAGLMIKEPDKALSHLLAGPSSPVSL
jgi:hypothetical protein